MLNRAHVGVIGVVCALTAACALPASPLLEEQSQQVGRKLVVGVNAAHLFDGFEYNDDFDGQPGWFRTIQYAQYLEASYIRVYGGYRHEDPTGTALNRANSICGAHEATGMRFLVSLTDKDVSDSQHSFMDVMYTWRDGSESWRETAHWIFAEALVSAVNGRCPNAIFAWELGNELVCHECIDSPDRATRQGWYEDFLVRMPHALRAIAAPTQKISLGLIRVAWADHYVGDGGVLMPGFTHANGSTIAEIRAGNPGSVIDWQRVYGNPDVSFITLHPYGSGQAGTPSFYDDPASHYIDVRMAQILGKDVMIEEFGANPGDGFSQDERLAAFNFWIDWAQGQANVKYLSPWSATYPRFVGRENAGMNGLDSSCFPSGEGAGPRCEIEQRLRSIAAGYVPTAAPAPAASDLPSTTCVSNTLAARYGEARGVVQRGDCVQVDYDSCGASTCGWWTCVGGAWACAESGMCTGESFAFPGCGTSSP